MLKLFTSYSPFTRVADRKTSAGRKTFDYIQQDALFGTYQFKIFAVLWAIASLFHMAHSSVFDTELNYALLTLSAFYVLFRPALFSFIIFIVLQIFDATYRMPFSTNHWLFTAFVNLTILHTLFYLMFKEKTFVVDETQLLNTFAPVARIEVIILYFFTAFHKLNEAFFSPDVSCATDLLIAQNMDWIIPVTPKLLAVNAYFTVVLEFLIPLLLIFRKSRNLGILLGLVFHCVLSYSTYNAFYDFSSMIFAMYFLFSAPDFTVKIVNAVNQLKSSLRRAINNFNIAKLVRGLFVVAAAIGVIYLLNKKLDNFSLVHLYFFWTIYSLLFISVFVWFIASRQGIHKQGNLFSPLHWSLLLLPVIVTLNGMSPYLGLKTENSFAMFSNLRTEGGVSNHYIMPAEFQIFDFQRDVVEIVSSSDPALQKMADEHNLLVLFEFRNYLDRYKPDKVAYLLNGEQHTYRRNDAAAALAVGKNNYVLAKLMRFRVFNKYDPQPCRH